MARVRHRKSINPFTFQREVQRPDWSAFLGQTRRTIEIDLGFGRGEFLLTRAAQEPDVLFVGIEIRPYLIDKMQMQVHQLGLTNVVLILANIKEHLPRLFDAGMLQRVYIHFPDPWTQRKKHHKRRMVDANLVQTLYTLLQPGGQVHLMTDKEPVGLEMLALFQAHGGFVNACGAGQFCPTSTTGICTREEAYYLNQNNPIYRLKWIRS